MVKLYQRRAYAIAYGFVGNREDALEIAQEAFVKAYRAMSRFDTGLGELRIQIAESMTCISDSHREILTLRHVHELSYNEIAECLDIPRGTVMSRLHGARRSLRQAMEAAC